MKANEFRIGNLVYKNGELHRVTVQTFEDIGQGEYDEEDFTPLPITEEWLLKMGFVYIESLNVFRIEWGRNGLEFIKKLPDGNFYFELGKGSSKHITYVHKLQNLFYENTDYELILKRYM